MISEELKVNISLRVSEEDRLLVSKVACLQGKTVAAWVRDLIRSAPSIKLERMKLTQVSIDLEN